MKNFVKVFLFIMLAFFMYSCNSYDEVIEAPSDTIIEPDSGSNIQKPDISFMDTKPTNPQTG